VVRESLQFPPARHPLQSGALSHAPLIGAMTLGARIAASRAGTPADWLDGLCADLRRTLASARPGSIATHALLFSPPTSTPAPPVRTQSAARDAWRGEKNGVRLRMGSVGASGLDARVDRLLRAAASAGWPHDPSLDDPSGALAGARRDELIGDADWARAPLRSQRLGLGLFDFARGACALADGRVLILQADGLTPAWRASDDQLALLAGVADLGAARFDELFLVPERRRQRLLSLLGPAQQRVAPLLAERRTEREIGALLNRSTHTTHTHAKAIYRAWGVSNRSEMRDKWSGVDRLPG